MALTSKYYRFELGLPYGALELTPKEQATIKAMRPKRARPRRKFSELPQRVRNMLPSQPRVLHRNDEGELVEVQPGA